jgi:hypothetical protein
MIKIIIKIFIKGVNLKQSLEQSFCFAEGLFFFVNVFYAIFKNTCQLAV